VDEVDDRDHPAVAEGAERPIGLAPVEHTGLGLDALPADGKAQVPDTGGDQVVQVIVRVLGVAGDIEGVDADRRVVGALEAREERPPPGRQGMEGVRVRTIGRQGGLPLTGTRDDRVPWGCRGLQVGPERDRALQATTANLRDRALLRWGAP
jgi:hypothetical protein